jgi:pre-mRNA branch site protein p14
MSETSPIVFVRNLPLKLDKDLLFEHFGQVGSVRQIRRGIAPKTRGTAFVVYGECAEAVAAVEQLNGRVWNDRFLSVQPS